MVGCDTNFHHLMHNAPLGVGWVNKSIIYHPPTTCSLGGLINYLHHTPVVGLK